MYKLMAVTALAAGLAACGGSSSSNAPQVSVSEALTTYANVAEASFEDSLTTAQTLKTAIATLTATPNTTNLAAAKDAYIAARKPYSQTEVFRFDESFVSVQEDSVDQWEGQVNAWPLDEALIDYVDTSTYEGGYDELENVINSTSITAASTTIDVSTLSSAVLISLNEVGGSEANVATGYHAIEFLLWGQDKNGIGPGAGDRPVSDYYVNAGQGTCTSGPDNQLGYAICIKRAEYLTTAVNLLIADLTAMESRWDANTAGVTLRTDLLDLSSIHSLRHVLYGMGSLALGELASERMQVAFISGSTEDEHDCFSDTTHNSYFYNAKGIRNVYEGTYLRADGTTVVSGVSFSDLVRQADATADQDVRDQLASVEDAMQAIVDAAESQINPVKIDQMIGTVAQALALAEEENGPIDLTQGEIDAETAQQNARRALVETAIQALRDLTDDVEAAAAAVSIANLDSDTGTQF